MHCAAPIAAPSDPLIELPKGATPFWDARQGYVNAKWRGQGAITADRKKDAEADVLELSNHLATLEDVLAARGVDLEQHLDQLERPNATC